MLFFIIAILCLMYRTKHYGFTIADCKQTQLFIKVAREQRKKHGFE